MRFFAAVFAGLILGIFPTSSIVDQSIHAQNQEVRFFCGTYKGQPTTFIRHPHGGNVPFIVWFSISFSNLGCSSRNQDGLCNGLFTEL